jgi:hypothetical protein
MKKIFTFIFTICFLYTQNAHAVFDIMAFIISEMSRAQAVMEEVAAKKEEWEKAKTTATRGFGATKQCFGNPKNCNLNEFVALSEDDTIKSVTYLVEGKNGSFTKDLTSVSAEKLMDDLDDAIYQRGEKKSLEKLQNLKKKKQVTTATELSTLFAKGAVTHQLIFNESDDQYRLESGSAADEGNIEKILTAMDNIELTSTARVARILELRSYMVSVPAIESISRQQNRDENNN